MTTEKTGKKPAFTKQVKLTGKVKFNDLNEAKSFPVKGGMTKPAYSITLLVDADDEQLKELQKLHEEGVKFEKAQVVKLKQDDLLLKKKNNGVRPDTNKDKQETGLMQIVATRPEDFGAPKLFDQSAKPITRKFIRMGSEVKILVTLRSSNVNGTVQTSLRLEAVQIVHEEAGTFKEKTTGEDYGFEPVKGQATKAIDDEESPF